jgi:hypothetical protein
MGGMGGGMGAPDQGQQGPQSLSNILQLTPQGQALSAMKPNAPQSPQAPQPPGMAKGGHMKDGGSKKAPAYSQKVLASTAAKLADKISANNPKLSAEDVQKKALRLAKSKLDWEREEKPAAVERYGELEQSKYSDFLVKRLKNTAEAVAKRKAAAKEFLSQPTEPWTPPPPEKQAFDRSKIKDALEGFPGIEQTAFPRDVAPRANLAHVHETYEDPENRELIKQQVMRGLPLGGETFYASLYPLKLAALDRGIDEGKFNSFVHSIAPASARNSIMNEMAVGQFLRDMHFRGIPLSDENVRKEMDAFKRKHGVGLPLMDVHLQGVRDVLTKGLDLRELSKANIPTNYKIPTYGTQKAGDFGKSVVLDVHEAAGQTQGSRYHPYFTEQGGFSNPEYGPAEQHMLNIAKELGLPGGTTQAGRWFGGGELTGLRSPRGDALDLLEKQSAYTLHHSGHKPTPANIRSHILNMIDTGRGILLPYYKKEGMEDYRMAGYAEGSSVRDDKESLAEFICTELGYSPREVAQMMGIINKASGGKMSKSLDVMRLALTKRKAK